MKPMTMKPVSTLSFAAVAALAVLAVHGAQSPRFVEVLTSVGKASELPLERIATDSAVQRVVNGESH
ncbi:hypothetical protein [Paraburkholderia terricola]|uniref:Uncharacterized protein n=1 Tax=Paraburkholderia terricola TaxID=169427 RepID=A0ABU1LJD1_9BURK|nr:hypothetical protein [Paraburkholderia terricola]MDR6406670.1 hypothetical protein [Paraburkholderia terricola]MDR6479650.1 hypothetical protein [Paraburkholderia terricola]